MGTITKLINRNMRCIEINQYDSIFCTAVSDKP